MARIQLRPPPPPRAAAPAPKSWERGRKTKVRDWAPAGPWGDHRMEWRTCLAQPRRDHVRERQEETLRSMTGPTGPQGMTGYYGPSGSGTVWIEVRCTKCGACCCEQSQERKASFDMRDVLLRLVATFSPSCEEVGRELLAMEVMGA